MQTLFGKDNSAFQDAAKFCYLGLPCQTWANFYVFCDRSQADGPVHGPLLIIVGEIRFLIKFS